jgi:hypothetical protein
MCPLSRITKATAKVVSHLIIRTIIEGENENEISKVEV